MSLSEMHYDIESSLRISEMHYDKISGDISGVPSVKRSGDISGVPSVKRSGDNSKEPIVEISGDISGVPSVKRSGDNSKEPFVEISGDISGVRLAEVNQHVYHQSFFRHYIPRTELNVDARIGGYTASIFGVWEPKEVDGCFICGRGASEGAKQVDSGWSCSHPFTLHPAAKEIAYLLKCRDLPDTDFWEVAEDEWKKQMEATQRIVDAKDKKVTRLISEIYQMVGLAAAFQGLLITAVAQLSTSSKSNCSNKSWWLLALSLFATIVTATGVNFKVGLVGDSQKARDNAKPFLYERKRLLRRLMVIDGPGFDLMPQIIYKSNLKKFKAFVKKRIFPTFESFIFICLVVFGAVCGLAIIFICK